MLELGIFVSCRHSKPIELFFMYVCNYLFPFGYLPHASNIQWRYSKFFRIFPFWGIPPSISIILDRFVLRVPVLLPRSSFPGHIAICSPSFRGPTSLRGGSGQSPLLLRDHFSKDSVYPPTLYSSKFSILNSSESRFVKPFPSFVMFCCGGFALAYFN